MIYPTQKETYLLRADIMFSEAPQDMFLPWGTPSVRFFYRNQNLTLKTLDGNELPSASPIEVETPVSIASISREIPTTRMLSLEAYDMVTYLSKEIERFSLHNWRVRLFKTTHTAVSQIGWSAEGTYTGPHYQTTTTEHDIRDMVSEYAKEREGW